LLPSEKKKVSSTSKIAKDDLLVEIESKAENEMGSVKFSCRMVDVLSLILSTAVEHSFPVDCRV